MTFPNQFPTELLEEIVSCLDGPDLASISLVSRKLHAIAEPHLYRVVHLTYRGSIPSVFRLFVRTILTRPDLACRVQVLILRWADEEIREPGIGIFSPGQFTYVGDRFVPSVPEFSALSVVPRLVRYLKNAWRSRGIKGIKGIKEIKEMEYMPVIHAETILHLLPNLQSLDILAPSGPLTSMDRFFCSPGWLSRDDYAMSLDSLRELRLSPTDRSDTISPLSLLSILQLDVLTKLRIHDIDEIDEEEFLSFSQFVSRPASPITHLSIGFNDLTGSTLALVMVSLQNLTSLELVYNAAYKYPPDIPLFGKALLPLRDTLQELTIFFSYTAYIYDDQYPDMTVGSLREWPVLRRVRCPLTVLLGPDQEFNGHRLSELLPRVIVKFVAELDQFRCSCMVGHELDILVRRKEECGLDRFTELAIGGGDVNEAIAMLQAPCVAAGVELSKVTTGRYGYVIDED